MVGDRLLDAGDVGAAGAGLNAHGLNVAVHGCGGVGLSAVMIATALGANVIAIDVSDAALALASEMGAVATIDSRNVADIGANVLELTGGGAHVSIDAFGSEATCAASIAS